MARQVCVTRALVQIERGDVPVIETSRCRGCNICFLACPFGAIIHEHARLPET